MIYSCGQTLKLGKIVNYHQFLFKLAYLGFIVNKGDTPNRSFAWCTNVSHVNSCAVACIQWYHWNVELDI